MPWRPGGKTNLSSRALSDYLSVCVRAEPVCQGFFSFFFALGTVNRDNDQCGTGQALFSTAGIAVRQS